MGSDGGGCGSTTNPLDELGTQVVLGQAKRIIELEQRNAELERKLEETTIELGRVSWELTGANNKLAERDALIREAIPLMIMFNSDYQHVVDLDFASAKWLAKAKGVVGDE